MLDKRTSNIPTWEMLVGDFLETRVSCCCWFSLFMSLQLSLLMDLFLLSSDAKRTDFIIPREVIVNEVKLKMDAGTPRLPLLPPHVLPMLHTPTVPPAPTLQTPPPSTPQKDLTRKIVGRHPSFNMLTNELCNINLLYEFSMYLWIWIKRLYFQYFIIPHSSHIFLFVSFRIPKILIMIIIE